MADGSINKIDDIAYIRSGKCVSSNFIIRKMFLKELERMSERLWTAKKIE